MTRGTMSAGSSPSSQRAGFWLRRFVNVEPEEVAALLASFAMFFALLSAYYIVRPVRDEIGVALGKDALHQLFTVVFFVMLLLVPLFGLSAARFWLVMKASPDNRRALASFFICGEASSTYSSCPSSGA